MAKAQKIIGLDCEADALAGVRLVLSTRFEEMCGYAEAALDAGDIEGVHDMRVASRRLRSALRDFAPFMRRIKRLDRAREDLKRLADALGGARDHDVAIRALRKISADAPPEVAAAIESFADERHARREEAYQTLAPALAGESLEPVRRRFARALEEATRPRRRKKGDGTGTFSFREMGRVVIMKSWDELEALGPSLYRPFKTKRLHKMRIAAKRLRYALELFAACWGGAPKALAEEIEKLQDDLGELHDCDAWVAELGGQLSDAVKRETRGGGDGEGEAEETERHRRAAIWLLDHFAKERTTHYRRALERWEEWRQSDFAARLAECVAPDAGADVSDDAGEQEDSSKQEAVPV